MNLLAGSGVWRERSTIEDKKSKEYLQSYQLLQIEKSNPKLEWRPYFWTTPNCSE
jgi:hypothetical protein